MKSTKPLLLVHLFIFFTALVRAQTFTNLYSLTSGDGANSRASLILSGNTLYGTTWQGGSSDNGTVFKINTDGTGFTKLHDFTATVLAKNSDGGDPLCKLVLSGNTLYGTTQSGGSNAYGTVFAVNSDGTGFTNLHNFTSGSDGGGPQAGLVLSGNTLYGTAASGGTNGYGTMFKINTDGTGFKTLYNFSGSSDGANPEGDLILSGNTLFGTAESGGSGGSGTVFAVNTDGTGYTNLYSFTATTHPGYIDGINSDGAHPHGLILSGAVLYGTAVAGGNSGFSQGWGTIFAVNTDGTGFTNLHSFVGNNIDGTQPYAGLILSGNTLYGTASAGGRGGDGTVFAVNTDGTGYTNLYSFTVSSSSNTAPYGGVILSGNTLFGTTTAYIYGRGCSVFSLSFAPQLSIIRSAATAILRWPTNKAGFTYSGYTLQFTTNLVSPEVWTTASPAPVVVSGQNTVTNTVSGSQKFYRLSQ